MRLSASFAVLSLALATPVFAQTAPATPAVASPDATPSAATPAVAEKKKDDGIVCRKETPTGSHFPVKVCTTAEQRKAERAGAQRAQQSMQGGGSSMVPQ